MKKLLLFPIFICLFLFSCSDQEHPLSMEEQEVALLENNTEMVVLRDGDDPPSGGTVDPPSSGKGNDEPPKVGGVNSLCVDLCNLGAKECNETAIRNRELHLLSCDYIVITIGVRDVYCTRSVIGWYEEVDRIIDGEVISTDLVPVYIDEEYVCGEEEYNIYSSDPVLLQEAAECRLQAQSEYVAALDKCDIKKSSCLKKCKKGPTGPIGPK